MKAARKRSTVVKTEKPNLPHDDQKTGLENHKRAAKNHELAAKHHLEAVLHHQAGKHAKAAESTIKALGHHALATEAQWDDAKQHTLTN